MIETPEQQARRIASAVLNHANPWYVSDTAHKQELVLRAATHTVLHELNNPPPSHESPVLPLRSVHTLKG